MAAGNAWWFWLRHTRPRDWLRYSSPIRRKRRSEALLRAVGVPVNYFLPTIEDLDVATANMPTASDVGGRATALLLTSARGFGAPIELAQKLLERTGAADALSVAEQTFLASTDPDAAECRRRSWGCEPALVLLWALGLIEDEMRLPNGHCQPKLLLEILQECGPDLRTKARLRPVEEILDAADFIYRLHWAVRENWIHQRPPPLDLDGGVVAERHHALNWLVTDEEDWDEVDTST